MIEKGQCWNLELVMLKQLISYLSTASGTSFLFVLSQDDGRVWICLRPVWRSHDLKAHLAIDVCIWSHKGAQGIQSSGAAIARETTLVINFVFDGNLLSLVNGASTSINNIILSLEI